jgi:Mpv17 / PMP22 family
MINDWYLTYPYLSALMTCSCKAGVADYIVQSSTTLPAPATDRNFNIGRNIGFIVYGGLYQGVFQQFMYGSVFPTYFDDSIPLLLSTLMQLILDMALLGPFLCLPLAYFVQSMCTSSLLLPSSNDHKRDHESHRDRRFNLSPDGTSTLAMSGDDPLTLERFGMAVVTVLQHGWEQYLHDVEHEHILIKYWSLWIPVKCFTFTLIPCHLRIVFIATISFFWMMILSNASSSSCQDESPS